jgi:hypothetical protein
MKTFAPVMPAGGLHEPQAKEAKEAARGVSLVQAAQGQRFSLEAPRSPRGAASDADDEGRVE